MQDDMKGLYLFHNNSERENNNNVPWRLPGK